MDNVSPDFVIPMLQQKCFQIQSETTSCKERKRESMAANTRTTTTVDQKEK
jgi:hypothetical protein